MKRSFLLLVLLTCVIFQQSSFANERKVTGFSIQGILALPSGDLSSGAGTGIGALGTLKYSYSEQIELNGSIGYINFANKETSILFIKISSNYSVIPVTAGGRYYFKSEDSSPQKFYFSGEIGFFSYTLDLKIDNETASTSRNYMGIIPGIGMEMDKLDFKLSYSMAEFAYLGLQVGFMFKK